MTRQRAEFSSDLSEYGELHVTLESGDEFHLHKHDVKTTQSGRIVVDSKLGDWTFDVSAIEHIEYPHSHKE